MAKKKNQNLDKNKDQADLADLADTNADLTDDLSGAEESVETSTDGIDSEAAGEPDEPTADVEPENAGVVVVNSNIHPDARWYVVHTYSGHENKVAVTLKQRAEAGGYTDRIFKLYLPQQQKIMVSEGRKRSVDEKLYPGYLMVQMLMDDDSWYIVRSTPGVTGFVGMGSTPTPLSNAEVIELMKYTKQEAPRFEAKFVVGDSVKINEGPFRDFLGKVDEVNDEQGKVKVLVSVFGRETPVELDFAQVNRI